MNNTTTRVWIALFVGLVFISGLAGGLAVSTWFQDSGDPRGFRGGFRGRPFGPPAMISERFMERLETDPEFTDERRQRLEDLFEDRRGRFRSLNLEMRQRFQEEQASLRADMEEVLTPAQMGIFDETRQRPGRGGPGGIRNREP